MKQIDENKNDKKKVEILSEDLVKLKKDLVEEINMIKKL